jgi:hypothetical protein
MQRRAARPTGAIVPDFSIITLLRARISKERDPQKIHLLCDLLTAVVRDNDAELGLRLKLAKKQYERLRQRPHRKLQTVNRLHLR